jgi:hypothetical protein
MLRFSASICAASIDPWEWPQAVQDMLQDLALDMSPEDAARVEEAIGAVERLYVHGDGRATRYAEPDEDDMPDTAGLNL